MNISEAGKYVPISERLCMTRSRPRGSEKLQKLKISETSNRKASERIALAMYRVGRKPRTERIIGEKTTELNSSLASSA